MKKTIHFHKSFQIVLLSILLCFNLALAGLSLGIDNNVYAKTNKKIYKDFKYKISNGKAYITDYVGKDKTKLTIPAKIKGKHVVSCILKANYDPEDVDAPYHTFDKMGAC